SAFVARYGAPYLTIHRADLQRLLLEAARSAGTELRLQTRVAAVEEKSTGVVVRVQGYEHFESDAVVAADGVWSTLREAALDDGPANPSGHIAYRALVAQHELPSKLRSEDVNVWLGPRTH